MPYVSIALNVATSMNALRTVWNYPDEYKNVIHLGCFLFFQRKFPNKLNHLEREGERQGEREKDRERQRETVRREREKREERREKRERGKAVQFCLFYIELDP